MSYPPPVEPVPSAERLYADGKNAEEERLAKPSMSAFSVALAKADRSGGRENALTTDRVRADTPRHEYPNKTLDELPHAVVGDENSSPTYAPVEIDLRVAQAQIEAAQAQRDAANAQKIAAWAILALMAGALLGGGFALLKQVWF